MHCKLNKKTLHGDFFAILNCTCENPLSLSPLATPEARDPCKGELVLRDSVRGYETLPTLAATFTNIKSFFSTFRSFMPSYTLLLESWPQLERLGIVEIGHGKVFDEQYFGSLCLTDFLNLDAAFCGISAEEPQASQAKDEELFKEGSHRADKASVHWIAESEEIHVQDLSDKVTGCVAFSRMYALEELRLEIVNKSQNPITGAGLKHLKRYMKVVGKEVGVTP